MSANPAQQPKPQPVKPPPSTDGYLRLTDNLIGKTVAYIHDPFTVYPCRVTGIGTPDPDRRPRLHLTFEEQVREEQVQVNDDTGEVKRINAFIMVPRARLNVQYWDPSLVRDRDGMVIDPDFRAAPALGKFRGGKWFFIDRFRVNLTFIHYAAQKVDRIRGIPLHQYADPGEIKELGWFDDYSKAWTEWLAGLKKGAGTWFGGPSNPQSQGAPGEMQMVWEIKDGAPTD